MTKQQLGLTIEDLRMKLDWKFSHVWPINGGNMSNARKMELEKKYRDAQSRMTILEGIEDWTDNHEEEAVAIALELQEVEAELWLLNYPEVNNAEQVEVPREIHASRCA